MGLSSELISQFVKATKPEKPKATETTVYGTVKEQNGDLYVQLDGSDVLTPVSSTVKMESGERVVVQIKDHTATVTGNLSTQSARSDDVEDNTRVITELGTVVAGKVSTEELEAETARIEKLIAGKISVEELEAETARIEELIAGNITTEELEAELAEITKLIAGKVDADFVEATYATIKDLNATNAEIYNLSATYATIEQLDAERARISDLETEKLDAKEAEITYATIGELDAEIARIDILEAGSLTADSAIIKDLQAGVADIDTLIFGSASGESISTEFANAVIAQLGNAQIKSAMIESVVASQITAGDIVTNNVRVVSEDGKLLISDETIQISDSTRVRVQIGKDAAGDYSINIWDVDGNLMFSEGGITDDAIKDAIIRDDMVSDMANISAHKLNIVSLFEEINGSEHTIKSSKVYFDDKAQTLDVAFTSLTDDVEGLGDSVSSQGTQLSIIQGQINSKVWQQDIDAAESELDGRIDTLSTQYSELKQDVNGISATVATHTTEIANKADASTVTAVQNKASELEVTVDGIETRVSSTESSVGDITSRVSAAETQIEQNKSEIALRVSTTELSNTLDDYYTAEETDAAIEVSASGIRSSVSSEITEKVNAIEVGGRNLALGSANNYSPSGFNNASETITGESGYTITDETYSSCKIAKWNGSATSKFSGPFFGVDNCFGTTLVVGETYTLSAWMKADVATKLQADNFAEKQTPISNSLTIGTTWTRIWRIFVATSEYCNFCFYSDPNATAEAPNIYMCGIKLEKGNKATDWAPAPEDMATVEAVENAQSSADAAQTTASDAENRVSVAETIIQQLADMISTLVTDGNGVSLMTQTENGWTFSTAAIQESVENTAAGLGELSESLDSVDAAVDALDAAVQGIGVIAEYIKLGTYTYIDSEGIEQIDPSIDLGDTGSEFKLKITNRRILFTNGAEVIVRIDSETNSLHIGKAYIEDELKIGDFILKKRANGNVGLMWKG